MARSCVIEVIFKLLTRSGPNPKLKHFGFVYSR